MKWVRGWMIRIAEMEATRSILREWTWRKDHLTMIPRKIVIIIQILITNLNIDKSLAITRNKMIRSPIDLQIWDTLREKLIKVDITAKDSMRRKADQEIAKIDMKKEDKINSTILKVKTKIKMVCKISNKNLINPQ